MWIYSKCGDCLVNTEYIEAVFAVDTDVVAYLNLVSDKRAKTIILGRYANNPEALKAVCWLSRKLPNAQGTITMPEAKELEIIREETKWKSPTGKKPTRKGGS